MSEPWQIGLENETALVMLFTSKTKFGIFAAQKWKIRPFLNFFWTQNDLAWITAIFCFKKYDNISHIFFKNLNFGLLARSICVLPELFDIGGSERII